MKVIPIMLVDEFYGKLYGSDPFYFRRSQSGRIYACRCPDRSKHVKTAAETANQQRFAQKYARKKNNNV